MNSDTGQKRKHYQQFQCRPQQRSNKPDVLLQDSFTGGDVQVKKKRYNRI